MDVIVSRRRAGIGSWLIVLLLAVSGCWLFAKLTWFGILSGLALLALSAWQADLLLHTVYTYEAGVRLTVQRGRYGSPMIINLSDVLDVSYERRQWGMWRFVLLTLRDGRLVTLQPERVMLDKLLEER